MPLSNGTPPSTGLPAPGGRLPASAVALQDVAHAPQCVGSVLMFVQIGPASLVHFTVGRSHDNLHVPLEQICPCGQASHAEASKTLASIVASGPSSIGTSAFAQATTTTAPTTAPPQSRLI